MQGLQSIQISLLTASARCFQALNLVSAYGLALAGGLGGGALGILVLWLLVVRKRKRNITSGGTSESDSLLQHDQTQTDLQRDSTLNAPLCSICAELDLRQILLNGILKEKAIPLGSLSYILQKSDQCGFCRLVSLVVRRTWLLDQFPHLDLSGIECGLFSFESGCLREPRPEPRQLCHRLIINTSHRPRELRSALTAAHSALTLHIQVMEEDAFKFDRPTDLHGRRVNDTVDVGLVKKWIELCEDHFNILSGPSFPSTWVGTVILPLDPAPPDSLEFIVLSRTSAPPGVYDEEGFGKAYRGCMLYVMAVSQNDGLMERVGLGVIHEAAWVTSGAQEKVVFLR